MSLAQKLNFSKEVVLAVERRNTVVRRLLDTTVETPTDWLGFGADGEVCDESDVAADGADNGAPPENALGDELGAADSTSGGSTCIPLAGAGGADSW